MSRAIGAGPPRSPLSPLSMTSNESSFVGQYGSLSGPGSAQGTPNDVPYNGGPYGAARPLQTSPPSSQHPSGSTDMSRPSNSGSMNRPPSSASSIGMSNDGRMGFGQHPPRRDSSKSHIQGAGSVSGLPEDALQKHYGALKHYLADSLRDEKGNVKQNRARDKLLRLSVTQFMELSTDVYDELIRREDERTRRVENVPRSLPPKQNFHPKRNQARQKLSTLPAERFRQLATDVFYELERRTPRFGGDMGRPRSTASNASSRGGMRPPPGPGYYPPGAGRGGPGSPYGYGPGAPGSQGSRRPSEAGSLGRPLPKHFQSNTLVPNKSTMVEDDDVDDEDAFGLDHLSRDMSDKSSEDKERLQAQETEISELKEKLENLEAKIKEKDDLLIKHGDVESERNEWRSQREELEQKHMDASTHVESLQKEISSMNDKLEDHDRDRGMHEQNMQDLHEQLDDLHEQLAAKHDENGQLELRVREGAQDKVEFSQLQSEIEDLRTALQATQNRSVSHEGDKELSSLREELARQEKLNMQVREEAMQYLREMREMSRQNDEAIEQEEKMAAKVARLEQDNNTWRQRYAKIKAQNKSLRASTMGLGLQSGLDSGSLVRQEGLITPGGLVRDTDVTRFQIAIDDLLKVARQHSTDAMSESVKSVAVSIQSITSQIRTEDYPTPEPSPLSQHSNPQQLPAPSVSKLKARVNGTANSLITATKQHAASHGLSPVALLDAAASNCTASMVELIKAVKIRPSAKSELEAQDGEDDLDEFYADGGDDTNRDGLTVPVPQISTTQPPPPPQQQDSGASAKKGWFGWAGKLGSVDSGSGHVNGHGGHHEDEVEDSESDYDPYR